MTPAVQQPPAPLGPSDAALVAAVLAEARVVWAPPPELTVSQWADAHRYLSSGASAEPGRWHTGRAEYQRGIMDAAASPDINAVVVVKAAQVGWTEVLCNVVGFTIHMDPAPILVVQPTIEMGEAWSKDRLSPMLRDSPALRGLVADARSRDGGNTLRQKSFAGGVLAIAGANSAASLASRPIRLVLLDEVDRYPPSAGTEGDPVTLARKRSSTFWNAKVFMGSTPLLTGTSRIAAAFQGSDRRRFWVPCPHCGEMQVLRWEQVKWSGDDATTALYHCTGCGAGLSDVERWQAVNRGEWRAEAPFTGTAGFHISELYSPWRRLYDTVSDFMAARGRPEMLKAWKNTALGETWQEQGEAPEWERLVERREPFKMGVVPARAVVLTVGIDNQAAPERLEVAVWAWGPGYESWLVDVRQFPGSPADQEPWDQVHALLTTEWPREGGGAMRIAAAAADTGGQHTAGVYTQLRRLRGSRLVPIKGVSGWTRATPVSGPAYVDWTESGRKIKRGLRLWTVAVDVFKSELYQRLWLSRGDGDGFPAGWVHLPDGLDAEQVKQLVAEQLVTIKDRRGFARREWQKLRANEQLDMAVYARAALSVLGSDRYGERFWKTIGDRFEVKPPEKAPPNSPPIPEPRSPLDGPVKMPQPREHQGPVVMIDEAPKKKSRVDRMA